MTAISLLPSFFLFFREIKIPLSSKSEMSVRTCRASFAFAAFARSDRFNHIFTQMCFLDLFSAWEKNGSIWMQLFFFPGWWFELVELVSLVSVHFRDARFDFFVPSSLYWEFHLYSFFSNGWYFYRKIIFFAVLPLSLSFKYSYCYHFSFPFINRQLQLQTVLTTFLVPEKLFSLLHLSEFETVAFFFFFLTWKIFKVEIGSNCFIFFTFPLGNISLCLRCCRCLHPHTCLLLFVFLYPFLCRPIHMCACVC